MNKAVLMGRLTRDPEVRYVGPENIAIVRFTLAVDRRYKKEGEATADFISCVAFGNRAEFLEKYTKQGTKLALSGHIQTGSYTNRDGVKVYTTEIIVEEIEFAESKNAAQTQQNPKNKEGNAANSQQTPAYETDPDGFMNIPDGIDEELPFA